MKTKLTREARNKGSPWAVRWSQGADDSGKEKWFCRSFHFRADAEKFKANLAEKFQHERAEITLAEFLQEWQTTRGRSGRLRAATVGLYRNTMDRLMEFFGGKVLLSAIELQMAERFINAQRNRKVKDKPLSQQSKNQLVRNCKSLFAAAIEWGYLDKNPFRSLRETKPEKRRWHRLTANEINDLLNTARNLRTKVFYALALTTGARFGELFSLMWSDIDFERGRILIANREGTGELPPFKVKDHEQRNIPLCETAITLLTELQAQVAEGHPLRSLGLQYVLLSERSFERVKAKWQALRRQGKPWQNRYMVNNVLRNFKMHCRRAGIKPIYALTLHTLRKNAAQFMADSGLPQNAVTEYMGHARAQTTQQYYSQTGELHDRKLVQAMDGLFGREKKYVSGTYGAILSGSEGKG